MTAKPHSCFLGNNYKFCGLRNGKLTLEQKEISRLGEVNMHFIVTRMRTVKDEVILNIRRYFD